MKFAKIVVALMGATFLATGASAATKLFEYADGSTTVASGSFSYADGASGVLGYGDLTDFSVTLAGKTYTLADVGGLSDYVHFAYDTAANVFNAASTCGFAGCGYTSTLSAINSGGNFGFFFTAAPGVWQEYTTYNGGGFTSITISDAAPGVPEPASWAMMIGGFGLVGAAMRRRKAAHAFS